MRNILITCLLFAGFSASLAQGEEIKVSALSPHSTIGILGKPLGTRIVIAGVETVGMEPSVKVAEMDGHALAKSVTIVVKGKLKLQKGIRYKLEGYETGYFGGKPDWVSPKAQQSFTFHSYFVVTKVLEPASKP